MHTRLHYSQKEFRGRNLSLVGASIIKSPNLPHTSAIPGCGLGLWVPFTGAAGMYLAAKELESSLVERQRTRAGTKAHGGSTPESI